MATIPSGSDAHEAWNELTRAQRAEVLRRAEHGEGHPDAAVAAVAVGRARADRWPWWRTAMQGVGLCLAAGGALAILAAGGALLHLPLSGMSALALPTFSGYFLMDGAGRIRGLPQAMETANLRTFLASPDARPSESAPPSGLTPRRLATAIAVTIATLAVAVNVATVAGLEGGLVGGLRRNAGGIALGAVLLAGALVVQARRRPIRVRADEEGVRFNWGKPIPWSDIEGVSVKGGDATWTRTDGTSVTASLNAHGPRPEQTILRALKQAA